ncbi:hypothetical protein SDC9_207794 [bioreactor metagenome]|uniref:Uncharacterized protein n=1 Tax=bioreactor metagenome TaxID=1076179 RepID=A0A645J8X8_9ZZZZ
MLNACSGVFYCFFLNQSHGDAIIAGTEENISVISARCDSVSTVPVETAIFCLTCAGFSAPSKSDVTPSISLIYEKAVWAMEIPCFSEKFLSACK